MNKRKRSWKHKPISCLFVPRAAPKNQKKGGRGPPMVAPITDSVIGWRARTFNRVRARRDPVEVVSPRLPRYDDREIGTSSKNPVNYSPKHPGCNDGVKLLSRRDSNKQPESSANKPDSNKQNWKINLLNFCLVLDAFFVEKIHKWVMIFLKSTCQRTFASPARCEAKHADDHLDKWP